MTSLPIDGIVPRVATESSPHAPARAISRASASAPAGSVGAGSSAPVGAGSSAPVGATHFVRRQEMVGLQVPLADSTVMFVRLGAPSPNGRGYLREAIDLAIENELARRGAPPPGLGGEGDLDATLSDQLFRARAIGAEGIALYLERLDRGANLARSLDADDSAVLRWWLATTRERPVIVLLDEEDRGIGAYGPPVRLEDLIGIAPHAGWPEATPAPTTEVTVERPRDDEALPASETAAPTEVAIAHEQAQDVARDDAETAPPVAPVVDISPLTVRLVPEQRELARPPSEPGDVSPAVWRAWADELDTARGPKPMAAIERLFVSRYVPLSEVVARGQGDAHARAVLAAWGASFAKSYTEAYGALRVTGKKPMMVLDAPVMATRLARLHGAKLTQLVLVDGMRFDLGLRVHERMRLTLSPHATCTERLLLWAALPSTTPTQLGLIATGPDGLSGREPPSEREEPMLRGRNAGTLRRIKVGPRDLFKLDVAEARLREVGPAVAPRLDAIADEVAQALVTHAQSLPPRTLLFVFGDHGFRLEPDASNGATGPATQGGAWPEEVLVPAFAWLVGGLH